MADVNVQKRDQEERGRGGEQRSQLARRGAGGLPGFFGSPMDLLAMSPFTLMRRLTDDMDRMFSGMGGAQGQGQTSDVGLWVPPVEVREEGNNLVVNVELPGLDEKDVRVEIKNDSLVIQGEREREQNEERGGIRRSERYYGSFYRAIPLPEGVNAEQAKAQLNNGVLEIRIPIPEAAQRTRQIPIESGGQRKPAATQAAGQTQQSKAG